MVTELLAKCPTLLSSAKSKKTEVQEACIVSVLWKAGSCWVRSMDLFQPLMYLASVVGYVVGPMSCGHRPWDDNPGFCWVLRAQVLASSRHRFSPLWTTYQFGIWVNFASLTKIVLFWYRSLLYVIFLIVVSGNVMFCLKPCVCAYFVVLEWMLGVQDLPPHSSDG